MKENQLKREIVLSLETSVMGGSISLLKNNKVIDFWQGEGSISKSEDILDEISKILKKNAIEKARINQIVVSIGPGSFTGTRIGLAIASGLKKSLDCVISGVSVLKAMALQAGTTKKIITAIPVGSKICAQEFFVEEKGKVREVALPYLQELEFFVKSIVEVSNTEILLNGQLYNNFLDEVKGKRNMTEKLISSDENLASLIGRFAREICISDNIKPVYIKEMQ